MESTPSRPVLGLPTRIGVGVIVLWAVLHLWVGVEGLRQFFVGSARSQWDMFLGGANAPKAAFVHATDAVTANVHAHELVNFGVDVAGYGVLALVAAWMIQTKASWTGYFLFLVVVGICDLAFLFSLVTSGIIELNAGTVGGPVLWFIACALVPMGMPRRTA